MCIRDRGNVPHPVFGEVPLHVVAGHDIITPQTREVFGDDHIDLLRLNVSGHPPETGAVKIRAAPAIVHVGIIDVQPMLLHKLPQ